MTYIDSNVLFDIIQPEPRWVDWSRGQLAACSARGALRVNDIVLAEISVSFQRSGEVEGFLASAGITVARSSPEALFAAARAQLDYRRRSGVRTGVLPDFFIGADAAAHGAVLLTRDARRYRAYFPNLTLLCP